MKAYENPALSPEERADDLLSQMSLEEKWAQINCYFYNHGDIETAAAHGVGQVATLEFRVLDTPEDVARVQREIQEIIMSNSAHHIPAAFHMEGLNGALVQDAVSFPEAIGRASSFDPELEEQIAGIISRQELALGITQIFAPVLDINRDPRMGRLSETYGEDPTLAAAMGTAYTRGIQETVVDGRKAESAAKHFLGFHNSLGGIHGADCQTGPRQLREVYAKPFQAAITEAGLRGIMPCYNTINGKPISASRELLTDLLRDKMGFDGVVVSDYSAVSNIHTTQHLCESMEDAGLASLTAGMDIELPNQACFSEALMERFRTGEVPMEALDRAVYRILCAKFRMGLFEHPCAVQKDLRDIYNQPEDGKLTLQSALESLILLKNENHTLPIGGDVRKIAVIGPHADNARHFFGGYTHLSMVEAIHAAANSLAGVDAANSGSRPMTCVPGTQVQWDETEEFNAVLRKLKPACKSLLEELRERLPTVEIVYAYGYPITGNDTSHFVQALEAAKDADLILLTLGGKNGSGSIATMGEGVDGTNINLPYCQDEFIRQAAKLGKPMIGLHFDGRPISSDAADEHLNAILECWNPAERGAEAIVKILLGEANPSGKLPVSVAYHAGQIPVFYNHPNGSSWHQGESIGFQNYVDLTHMPRYCFGHGLSYTAFEYQDCTLDAKETTPDQPVTVRATIRNTGNQAGTEIVQLYLRDRFASMVRPERELAGFARVSLLPGEEKEVVFSIHPSQTAFLDENMRWRVEKGTVDVLMGSSSQDIRWQDSFEITETGFVVGRERKFYDHHKL